MKKDSNNHSPFKYEVELTPYPQKKTLENRPLNSGDSKNFLSLNKALDETKNTLKQTWSKESLIQEFRDNNLGLHYRVYELPLIEIINETTSKKGHGTFGRTIGYDLSLYSGLINLSESDSSNKYLDYLVNPNQEDYKGIKSVCIWHDDGQSEFLVADKAVKFYYGGDPYTFEDYDFILDKLEAKSLLTNCPPVKALKPTIEELYIDKYYFNFWLNTQLFKLNKKEIDLLFNSALLTHPKLEKLSQTGLFFEEDRIGQLHEKLEECFIYLNKQRRNSIECLNYWLASVHPILITHSFRYLEFLYRKDQIDFSEVKQSILDGDLDKIDHFESFSLVDAKEVFNLICLCWLPIKQFEYYTSDINESIVKNIQNISSTTSSSRWSDLSKENKNLKTVINQKHLENKKLRQYSGDELLNEVLALHDEKTNIPNITNSIGSSAYSPDFDGARKPESDTKNFIIDAIEIYFTDYGRLPENYKKLKFWLVTNKPRISIYKIITGDPQRPLEVEYFKSKSDPEFSRTFNSALKFLKNHN